MCGYCWGHSYVEGSGRELPNSSTPITVSAKPYTETPPVRPGDIVHVSFTARVEKVGTAGEGWPVWVLVNSCWFPPPQYEVVGREDES